MARNTSPKGSNPRADAQLPQWDDDAWDQAQDEAAGHRARRLLARPSSGFHRFSDRLAALRRWLAGERWVRRLRYMSPEQVRGESTNASADVFSLGLVLYELSTGTHPFPADNPLTAADAIVEGEAIAPSRKRPGLPRYWDVLVLSMLAKDPASRPTAEHVTHSLEAYSVKSRRRIGTLAFAGLLLLGVAVFLASRWFLRTPEIRLTIRPLSGQGGYEAAPALSPDGHYVVYTWKASHADPIQVLLQEVGSDRITRLAIRHEGTVGPFTWTPDGRRISFYSHSGDSASFRVINTDGTHEEKLLDVNPAAMHAFSWSPDGRLLAFSDIAEPEDTSRIFLYSLENRVRTQLTRSPVRYRSDFYPAFSTDGSQVAFRRFMTLSDSDVWVVQVRNPDMVRRLTNDHSRGEAIVWTSDSRALIAATGVGSQAGLWFYPLNSPDTPQRLTGFGLEAFNVTSALREKRLAWVNAMDDTNIWRVPASGGPAVRVLGSAMRDNDVNCSRNGLMVFRSERSGDSELWLADLEGNSQTRATNLHAFTGSPRWSPDGRRIVFDSRQKNGDPQILAVDCEPQRRECGAPVHLTHESAPSVLPNWSADGRYVYFASQKTNNWQLWKVSAAGGTPTQVTSKGGYFAYESPDGKTLYYSRLGKGNVQGIWRKALTGTPNPDDEGEMILPLPYAATATWVLFDHEIFYETFSSDTPPSAVWAFDLNTGQHRIVHTATDKPLARGMSVSPDGGFVYFVQTDRSESSVIVADYKYSR